MCEFFSGDEIGEAQLGTTQPDVGEDGHGMHEHLAQQPTAQMPQIVGPDPLDSSALDELAEDGVDAVAPLGEVTAEPRPGVLFSTTERGQELDAAVGEVLTQTGRPKIAVTDEQAEGSLTIKVDADYTSQSCPQCGWTSLDNRPALCLPGVSLSPACGSGGGAQYRAANSTGSAGLDQDGAVVRYP